MKIAARFLSYTSAVITAAMVLPILWSLVTSEGSLASLLMSAAAGTAVTIMLFLIGRGTGSAVKMSTKDVVISVALAWLTASITSALPYAFSGITDNFIDALFEGVSGVTTTGATILVDLESIPRSLLLWRSMTQWIGGIGIVVIALIIFPSSSAAMNLFKAEMSGPIHDRLTPRIQDTAKFLCKTYVILTVSQAAILIGACGLDIFDAVTLSFSTVATGGFSPYSDNIAHFSMSVRLVTGVFLFFAASNLPIFHAVVSKRSTAPIRRSAELKFYASIFLTFSVLAALILYTEGLSGDIFQAIADGAFNTISMLSTCGYYTSDHTYWPASISHLMIVLMFIGGCSASSAGGLTCARTIVILKHSKEEFSRILMPTAVIPVRLYGSVVPQHIVASCYSFMIAYITVFGAGFALLALFGQDMTTAFTSAAAVLGNVGPAINAAGPSNIYAAQSVPIKIVYMILMFFGRLEIFTLLSVFSGMRFRSSF